MQAGGANVGPGLECPCRKSGGEGFCPQAALVMLMTQPLWCHRGQLPDFSCELHWSAGPLSLHPPSSCFLACPPVLHFLAQFLCSHCHCPVTPHISPSTATVISPKCRSDCVHRSPVKEPPKWSTRLRPPLLRQPHRPPLPSLPVHPWARHQSMALAVTLVSRRSWFHTLYTTMGDGILPLGVLTGPVWGLVPGAQEALSWAAWARGGGG